MSQATSTKLTYGDYVALPDDGKRYELIDGELILNPSPITKHQLVSWAIEQELGSYLRVNPIGLAFHAPFDVVFSEHDVVQTDIFYIGRERRGIITAKNIQGAPDLTVEIISEWRRRHDEIDKRNLYDRYGVGEYWIADPVLDTIKVYRRNANVFERVAELAAERNDVLTTPLLPGLSIELTRVFVEPWNE